MSDKRTSELEIWSESTAGRVVRRKGARFPELLVPDDFFRDQLDKLMAARAAASGGDVPEALRLLDVMAEEHQAWLTLFEAAVKKYGPRPDQG